MPRIIDANRTCRVIEQLFCGNCNDYFRCENCSYNDVLKILRNQPTVDAVRVVRCKECKYASLTYDGECKYCRKWKEKHDGESVSLYLDGDFYCAWGERKEDAETN